MPLATPSSSRVDQARERWRSRLVDTSRRNNLLYLRESASSSLDLGTIGQGVAALLGGVKVSLGTFDASMDLRTATARAQTLRKKALTNQEEKGLETLFIACGLASWDAKDGGRPTAAPILLVPVTVEAQGRDSASVTVQRAGDVQANMVLAQAVADGFGITLPGLEDGEPDLAELQAYLDTVEAAGARLPGWKVEPRVILSNFAYQKLAMVQDLNELASLLASHPLVAALAGDAAAATSVRRAAVAIDPRTFDQTSPDQEFLVTDADSSQQAVIAAAVQGQHLVVEGPPGTGKSQTITNLIATLAAEGKRVLFVAEKRAALEVVQRRLEVAGLGHLILDLHGADVNKRQVLQRVGQGLQRVRDAQSVDASAVHAELLRSRQSLNDHAARIHQPRPPWNVSVHEVTERLLALSAYSTPLRWRGQILERLTDRVADGIAIQLAEWPAVERLVQGTVTTLWSQCDLASTQAAEEATDRAWRLVHEVVPQLQRSVEALSEELGIEPPASLSAMQELLGLTKETRQALTRFQPTAFEPAFRSVLAALAPAQKPWWSRLWSWLTSGEYRGALAEFKARIRQGMPGTIARDVAQLTALNEKWSETGGAPALLECSELAEAFSLALVDALAEMQGLQDTIDIGHWREAPLAQVLPYVQALADDRDGALVVAQTTELRKFLISHGIESLLVLLIERKAAQDTWGEYFRAAWLASIYDQVRSREPNLAAFDGRSHDKRVTAFQGADRKRLTLASSRLVRRHAEVVIAALNEKPDQADLIRREVQKKTRHMPLRKLFGSTTDVLGALFPCWMASPLSVSQLLRGQGQVFDVCIFDEASQVQPEDAITAIVRARQTIVAGDPHQLPPTTFFAAQEEADDAEEDDTAGYESLLDNMAAVAESRRLEWHYRSRDESLIAFSNRHIYDDRLVTFPGPEGQGVALQHVLVQATPAPGDQTKSSAEEIRSVVGLILEHARNRPGETLGVIAFGIEHGNRLEAALWEARRQAPELDEFFDESREERFFVKNLERVQGDERDAILLSVGYGKDHAGRLPNRFGPLNMEGGHRRLNVAITRARRRMTVVSSFSSWDMDPSRMTGRGVDLLRRFLAFAESGGRQFADKGEAPIARNPFEQDICNALGRRGIELVPQWGVSSYRIDFVARHPEQPGRFVLAIECDGASYHSSPTARDRDRLRQQHLEALGWRFHRIWSQDWFTRRDAEIERAVRVFEEAVREVDARASRSVPPPPPPPVRPMEVEPAQRRMPRPAIAQAVSIDGYARHDLVALVQWIRSDDRLRTDDEILAEMIPELGFKKRGARIEAAIRQAIEDANLAPMMTSRAGISGFVRAT